MQWISVDILLFLYAQNTSYMSLISILNLVGLIPEDSSTENFGCHKAARVILG